MQTSSIAVAATVTALVVALGVSGAAMRGREADRATPVALGTASSASQVSQRPSVNERSSAAPGRASARAPSTAASSPGATHGRQEAEGAASGGGGSGAAPPSTDPGAPPVPPAGDGSKSADGGSRLALGPAAAGDWYGSARVTDRTGLLGENEQTLELRIAVGPQTSGAQRLDVDGNVLAFAGETVRYDGPGRRAFVLDVWTGDPELVRFTSQDGFVAVPATVRAGSSWSWADRSADGLTSLDSSIRVVGERRTTYAGDREIDVVDLEQTVTIGGDRSLTVTRRFAFAPEIGLPISITEDTKGTNAAGTAIDRSVVFELTTTGPAPEPVVDRP